MRFRALVTACLLGVLLAACGSSSPPSAMDPTPLVPPNAAFYLDLTIRPQGSLRASAESALTRLIGHSPDPALRRAVNKLLRRSKLDWSRDIQPWLGQHVALFGTGFSAGSLALVAPTTNPSAALAALRGAERGAHAAATTYKGIRYQEGSQNGRPEAFGIVGHAAVIGGPAAFQAVVDAYHGRSIENVSGFSSAFGALPANSLVEGYINGPSTGAAIRALLAAVPSSVPLSTAAQARVFDLMARRFRGQYAFAIAVSSHSFTVDFRSSLARPGQRGDVSRLAGQSWLALSTGAVNGLGTASLLEGPLAHNPIFALGLARFRQRFGVDLVHDVLPALGPIQLSVQGTSPAMLGAGLALTPVDPAAAHRLLAAIFHRASHSRSLSVHGSPSAFTVTRGALPIPRVSVAEGAGRVLATFDETLNQALAPATLLSSNPDFQRARAALPAGSRISLFIDFRSLTTLVQNLPPLTSARDKKVMAVVRRLDYAVLGESPSGGETRLVLALR